MKPIIFSTPMVQAILEGRKTMTRRVVGEDKRGEWVAFNDVRKNSEYGASVPCYLNREIPIDDTSRNIMYPKFDVGDILWVRETWCENRGKYFYKADNICNGCTEDGICLPEGVAKHITCELCEDRDGYIKWRPSIHMPRTAARIFLRVTNVRVERLHDITENDAKNEGVKDPYDYQEPSYYDQPHVRGMEINKSAFAGLWDSLNEKRGYGWRTNPWVWVIEFEKISKEEAERLEGLK